MEYLLEHYRNELGITKEQEELLIEELRAKNPVVLLETKVDNEVTNLDERTQGMQQVDQFTLDQTFLIDERTAGMQDIDQFSLDLIFSLQTKVDELEQRIATLEGGN